MILFTFTTPHVQYRQVREFTDMSSTIHMGDSQFYKSNYPTH